MIPRLFGAWSFCLYSINTQINYYIFTRKCGKTQKHLKTPWPGVFNQGVFRACLANFHTNMWRTRTKAAENPPCAAKCGGTWKNPHQKATFLHENVAKHTKPILRRAQTPWPGVFNQGVFRACPVSKRCAWIHYKSAIRFDTNMWRNTHKSSWKSAKMGRNTRESSSKSYIFTRKCRETHK